jgi:hypothetical protein
MGQVTLYLDSQTEQRMKAAARAAGTSQSRWIASLIRETTSNEWPSSIAQLAGSWADDFPTLEEIRGEEAFDDPQREAL